ncbi:MAG: hypothetical protein Q4F17_00780 [Eubacteriales bacterium]|nr:hypothetical protein [Eubacteriales bacterium]
MRLSDVLSKPITTDFVQIEGFLNNRKLKTGVSKKLTVGKVALNFYCNNCSDQRTFYSSDELFCIGVNQKTVSIDCVLECPRCGASVQTWFLVECREEDDIHSLYPYVRIAKRGERFSEFVSLNTENYGDFTEALEKAKRAARESFGAGSIVYLRKVFERIITQTAEATNPPIETKKSNGKPMPFRQILDSVKTQCNVIPDEFSEDGYRLFGELSDVVHGDYDEEEALMKFDAFFRLVTGVLEKIKTNRELMDAIGSLGWHSGGGKVE